MPDPITYDDRTDRLTFPDGKQLYCFGGNPSISPYNVETTDYGYGSDGGFYINEIGIPNAILMAEMMIDAWTKHKAYLEGLSNA